MSQAQGNDMYLISLHKLQRSRTLSFGKDELKHYGIHQRDDLV